MKIFLSHCPGAQGDNNLINDKYGGASKEIFLLHQAGSPLDNNLGKSVLSLPMSKKREINKSYRLFRKPKLLISFFYFKDFWKEYEEYNIEEWIFDSGAFSAKNSGVKISLLKYIEACKMVMNSNMPPREIFSLDAIGDWQASLQNTERMWKEGIEAIPTFHMGEPLEVLVGLARDYPKVGLGGMYQRSGKRRFIGKCFEKVWPKKLHGFAMNNEEILFSYPFYSVDASNWELSPCAFGNWKKFGALSLRGSSQNLRSQVEYYMVLEDKLKARWAGEMTLLETLGS